jgi:hypothetical protein
MGKHHAPCLLMTFKQGFEILMFLFIYKEKLCSYGSFFTHPSNLPWVMWVRNRCQILIHHLQSIKTIAWKSGLFMNSPPYITYFLNLGYTKVVDIKFIKPTVSTCPSLLLWILKHKYTHVAVKESTWDSKPTQIRGAHWKNNLTQQHGTMIINFSKH